MRSFSIALLWVGLSYAADLSQLGFMAGCWATPPGAGSLRVDEHWSRPDSGNMLGYSRTFKGDRMVFFEFMRLEVKGNDIVFTPRYGTAQKPVPFRLTKAAENEAVFENPGHDFPQRIIYRREGNKLHAAIDGKQNGKDRREEFPYVRVACP
jgi:hypothetical protein